MDDYRTIVIMEDWGLISYIISSKARRKILENMDYPKTPKQISIETEIGLSYVSKLLSEMVSKELVICLTPKKNKGKLYALTDKSKKTLLKIEERY